MGRLDVDFEEKQSKRGDLEELYESKTDETLKTETAVQEESVRLKTQVEDKTLMRKRDTHAVNQEKAKMQRKIDALTKALEKLKEELEEAKESIEEVKQKAEDNHATKMSICKKSLRPLDECQADVEEEKKKARVKIDQTEVEISDLAERREAMINEIEGMDGTKGELIAEKTQLHSDMDYFKDNYPEELKQFYTEERYKGEIGSLVKEKGKLRERLREQNARRAETREDIKRVFTQAQKLYS